MHDILRPAQTLQEFETKSYIPRWYGSVLFHRHCLFFHRSFFSVFALSQSMSDQTDDFLHHNPTGPAGTTIYT